ncbi:hypothetical protein O181_040763 [Austropuccinia psidii MF-1]|uniref:Reverse transcriptase domain-containing protein n=1 Tax=Austropuccinia psidii MF-1 TaxID=1389203 RepID=A0A9Q3DG12_9BASI|nr:hypothetical protein [Austropuccinia psidii MF-1]
MKAPKFFDGTQAHKLRGFIQSCQLIFHNDPANFFSDRKKVLYSTSCLTGRSVKWIEHYLSNIPNEDPSYPLNNWQLFETQLFTLFGDPNEFRKAEPELNNLRMKKSGHVSLRGLESRLLDQFASNPGTFDTLQELMDFTLELDARYHERQKEKGGNQEKKPPATASNHSRPPQNSSSKRPHQKKNKKGKQFQYSKDMPHAAPLNKDNSPKRDDLILGYNFLYHFHPIIDWKNGLITYDSSGIPPSASNDFATAVNSVALVGELKTPSLLSSFHIPSIIPSHSLLPLRDEVFKEIKDVVEDVAISSLHLFQGDMDLSPLSFHASLEKQWDEEEEPEEIETVLKVVRHAYHQYLDIFSKVKSEKLPPHHACDHHIELQGLLPPIGFIYSLSNQESEKLRDYISENVVKFFIRPSSSSTGGPVLFVKKKDGGLHLCVDYHKLNAVTRKNRYPVPPMSKLLTIFNSSTIFSKIDLHCAYSLLRIKEGDEHLAAFRTKYGSYEYLVMPFVLTNSPASFQNLVNDIFAYFLDVFDVVYLDDIMVFSSSEEEHVKHVTYVLQRLRENSLFTKASKGVFYATSVEYLGYVVSS